MSAQPETMREQLNKAVGQGPAFSIDGFLQRLFAQTFTGLVYPQIWEDPVQDMKALAIKPTDAIMTIASGGCNTMSYLTAQPASITAVDLSPAHIALNRLKYAAAQHLPDYDCFFQFFGRANVKGNAALYDTYLAPKLDASTRAFWEKPMGLTGRRIEMFEKGFYRYGALGRFIGAAHLISRLFGVDYKSFMASKSIDQQQRFFEKKMLPALNARLVKYLASNRASLFGLGIPPQQYEALAGAADGDMHAVLVERTRKLMCDFPLSENYFAWQAFNRGYGTDENAPLPPYLQRENFELVRANAHKARIHNRNMTDLLRERSNQSKDCYILLDAQDWMDDTQINALWTQITRTARSGARVIFRTAGVEDIVEEKVFDNLRNQWVCEKERAAELNKTDRSAIYGAFHLYVKR